jgi:hypothetical protein
MEKLSNTYRLFLYPLIILAVILAFLLLIIEILERITDFTGIAN